MIQFVSNRMGSNQGYCTIYKKWLLDPTSKSSLQSPACFALLLLHCITYTTSLMTSVPVLWALVAQWPSFAAASTLMSSNWLAVGNPTQFSAISTPRFFQWLRIWPAPCILTAPSPSYWATTCPFRPNKSSPRLTFLPDTLKPNNGFIGDTWVAGLVLGHCQGPYKPIFPTTTGTSLWLLSLSDRTFSGSTC